MKEATARRTFSAFDLFAGAGTQFLTNACITVVTPVALRSAEQRDDSHPLISSGVVAGATSMGMCASLLLMYRCSPSWLDGKGPFRTLSAAMLLGSALYLLGESLAWRVQFMVIARIVAALGFGALYATKRRASVEDSAKRREYLFLLLELSSSLGMASGPMLAGAFAYLLPSLVLLGPPICMIVLVGIFLVTVEASALDIPFYVHTSADEGADESRALNAAEVGDMPPALRAPHKWTSVAVTAACLSFGIGRNFLKFGFESAMVVVYDKQFHFSVDAAGILAGSCALSGLVSVAIYKRCCQSASGKQLLLVAEGLAFASSLLMVLTGALAGRGRVHSRLQLALATIASMLFYPAMYIGAAQGNTRPLEFAQPGHRFLSREAIVAQQDLFQTTIGKGLGMIVCRQALGSSGQLASLGNLFVGVVVAQFVVMALGWEPEATLHAASSHYADTGALLRSYTRGYVTLPYSSLVRQDDGL